MNRWALFSIIMLLAGTVSATSSSIQVEKDFASALTMTPPEDIGTVSLNDDALSEYSEYDIVYITPTQKITPEKKQEENSELHYTIEMTYPKIEGKNLSDAEKKFNQKLEQMIKEEVQQFKNSVKLNQLNMQSLPGDKRNNHLKIDYDVDVISPLSLVSVRLTIHNLQAGRAHAYRSHRVLNFDLANSKELALSDLFKPKTNYLQVIASYSHKKLNETVHDKDKWMISNGAKAVAKNYKNWNIEKDAILITFDEYQVAPYVYGAQEVEIPYSELQHLLSTQAKVISSIQAPNKNIG